MCQGQNRDRTGGTQYGGNKSRTGIAAVAASARPTCPNWLLPCSYAVVPLATLGAQPIFVGSQEGGWCRRAHPMRVGLYTPTLLPKYVAGMSASGLEAPCQWPAGQYRALS